MPPISSPNSPTKNTRIGYAPSIAASLHDPVSVARTLRPLLEKHAVECESEGRILDPVMKALRDSGLFYITVAKRSGGPAVSLLTHMQTVAELGKACPGSAWAYGLLSGITGTAMSLPDELRALLFNTGDELFCSASAYTAVGIPTEGGYLVSGGWGYGSGSLHAAWALNGIALQDGAGKVVEKALGFIKLNDSKVSIEYDWKVAGLSGSGSNRIVAQNHFVPEALLIRGSAKIDPYAMDGLEPRDFWPWEPIFPLGVLSPMLGAAEGLLEAVRAKMPTRAVIGWNYEHQSDSHLLLHMLGEATMKIDSAWMHIERACHLMDNIVSTRPATPFEKARAQADCGYAMRLVREAGNTLMDIAGPGGFALSNSMQRLWRDLNIGSRHNALNSGLSLELYGRALTDNESNLVLLNDVSASSEELAR